MVNVCLTVVAFLNRECLFDCCMVELREKSGFDPGGEITSSVLTWKLCPDLQFLFIVISCCSPAMV